jgi:hypothetical protein
VVAADGLQVDGQVNVFGPSQQQEKDRASTAMTTSLRSQSPPPYRCTRTSNPGPPYRYAHRALPTGFRPRSNDERLALAQPLAEAALRVALACVDDG